jgi:hypothetical protein
MLSDFQLSSTINTLKYLLLIILVVAHETRYTVRGKPMYVSATFFNEDSAFCTDDLMQIPL